MERCAAADTTHSGGCGGAIDADEVALVSCDGAAVGTVVSVDNFGASDIIEIEKADGARFMVPMVPSAVLDVGERLVIDPAWA